MVELFVVVRIEPVLHPVRIVKNKIKDGALFRAAPFQVPDAFARRSGAEQSLEDLGRVGFGGHGRGG